MALGIQDEHTRDPFDEFLDTLGQEREVISEPDIAAEPSPEPEESVVEDVPDPTVEIAKFDAAMIPAETVVECIDVGFTSINTFIAKEEQEGASDAEKKSLTKATANWLKDTDIDLSPGKMLLFLVLMIYGPKTVQAFQTRKQNIENEQLKEENARLRAMMEESEREKAKAKEKTKPKEQKEVEE